MAERVILRAVEPADLPIFFEHQRDPVALVMAGMPRPRAARRSTSTGRGSWPTTPSRIRTIVADGEVAGNVLSFERDGRREVGYWIGRDHWGRGVATAALVAFLGEEEARPLHAGVEPHNGGSLRVLEKCGFAVCGEEDGLVILRLG